MNNPVGLIQGISFKKHHSMLTGGRSGLMILSFISSLSIRGGLLPCNLVHNKS